MRDLLHKLANFSLVRRVLTGWRPIARGYFELRFFRGDGYSPLPAQKQEKVETLFALARAHGVFARYALEVGCGSGYCTGPLLAISARVLATDIARNAVREARRRMARQNTTPASRVTYRVADLVNDSFPEGPFDLILCSDVLYYLRPDQLPVTCSRLIDRLEPGGYLLALHERAESDDGPGMMKLKEFGARTVHDHLAAHPLLVVIADAERPTYRATVLRRRADPATVGAC